MGMSAATNAVGSHGRGVDLVARPQEEDGIHQKRHGNPQCVADQHADEELLGLPVERPATNTENADALTGQTKDIVKPTGCRGHQTSRQLRKERSMAIPAPNPKKPIARRFGGVGVTDVDTMALKVHLLPEA